jgi:hypothetical protein
MLARMETAALVKAYAELTAEARLGGFGPPPEGEWSAEQLIAHVATNDELLAQTTERVLDGDDQAYYNHDAIALARLNEIVAAHGGLPALVDWLGETSARLIELAALLREDDTTAVHTHIRDGGATKVDQPLPWVRVLQLQASSHLVAHLAQLRALRQ